MQIKSRSPRTKRSQQQIIFYSHTSKTSQNVSKQAPP
jgi:hypothetical protein